MEQPGSADLFSREGKPWSAKEEEYLLSGLRNGEILEQLNVRIKRRIPSIVKRLAAMIEQMQRDGKSLDEICEVMGMDSETVEGFITKATKVEQSSAPIRSRTRLELP